MGFLKPQYPNTESAVNGLLKHLRVKVNPQSVTHCLQEHPNYPSLMAVDDCLMRWNVANETIKIAKEQYSPDKFVYPFIASLAEKGGRLIMVYRIDNGLVNYADENHKKATMPQTEFLQHWDGTFLYTDADENSGEKDYKQNQLKALLQSLVLPLGLVLLLAMFYLALTSHTFTWPLLVLSLIKLAGLAVSVYCCYKA